MKTIKENQSTIIIVVILLVIVLISQTNRESKEITGQQIGGQQNCPEDKPMTRTYADESSTGNWKDFIFYSSVSAAEDACVEYGLEKATEECDTYCEPCDGTFTEDMASGSGEITGYISGVNGDYYSSNLSDEGDETIDTIAKKCKGSTCSAGEGGIAAECKIRGTCICAPEIGEKQGQQYTGQQQATQNQQSRSTRTQRQQTQSPPPSQQREGFFTRLFNALFGIFGLIVIGKGKR